MILITKLQVGGWAMKNRYQFYEMFPILTVICVTQCSKNTSHTYTGKPFSDIVYNTGDQIIPGKVQCEYYDLGGEGIAYHDTDTINSGSGGLNPANGSYLNEFRKEESIDISYTKIDDREIDNNPFNLVEPEKDQLYVGWTEPGEWMNYTVRILESGTYKIGLMYTSNRGGKISLAINNKDVTGPIDIASTFAAADSIPWRQWHHWNYLDNIAEIDLKKGVHILTLTTVVEGNMNYDFLAFTLTK
jgi:hypothetical protein